MAQATKTREIELIQRSSKMLRYNIPDVPDGATVAKAYMYVKANPTDADSAAVLVKTIDPGASPAGQITGQGLITDTGADGSAVLNFVIGNSDLDGFALNKPYWLAIKCLLSNGMVVMPPASRTTVRVLPALIDKVN